MLTILFRYTPPMLALIAVAAGFLFAWSHRPLNPALRFILIVFAALPLLLSGAFHLLRPAIMLPLLPAWAPHPLLLIRLTGLPELAGALGLMLPRFRRVAATWLAVFMIVIFPANIYVAGQTVQGMAMPGVLPRTLLQAAYIVLLLTAGYGWPQRAR